MFDSTLPAMLAIDWPAVFTGLLVVAFLFVCVVLILTVLIQRPQGGGLSGAFGSSAGSSQSAFGAKTGDVLTIFTIGIFLLFLFVAVGLNWRISPPAATTPAVRSLDEGEQPADAQQGAPAQPEGSTESGGLDPLELPPDLGAPAGEEQPPPAEGDAGAEQTKTEADPPAGEDPPPSDPESKTEDPPTSAPSPEPAEPPAGASGQVDDG